MLADELLAHDLSTALTDGRVEPFFQPIVSLDDGHILGFEVLARWEDPVQGFISPERFIPIADRFGLLDRLLDQLMRAAFRAAADWPHSIFLGFNVSPTQLRDADLATRIAQAIAPMPTAAYSSGRSHRRLWTYDVPITATAVSPSLSELAASRARDDMPMSFAPQPIASP